jgi:hypothetical protein
MPKNDKNAPWDADNSTDKRPRTLQLVDDYYLI